MSARPLIVREFAQWTALSALRSGAGHPKSRDAIHRALDSVTFDRLFDAKRGRIGAADFGRWHRTNVEYLGAQEFCVGWAAKLVNVYLKTRVYLAGEGRAGLAAVIHPPIDAGLWKGIRDQYPGDDTLDELMHPRDGAKRITTINGIVEYGQYARIIEGCRLVARREPCKLIEVEQFWLSDGKAKR